MLVLPNNTRLFQPLPFSCALAKNVSCQLRTGRIRGAVSAIRCYAVHVMSPTAMPSCHNTVSFSAACRRLRVKSEAYVRAHNVASDWPFTFSAQLRYHYLSLLL
jgi:hypothetical protein